MSIQAFIFDLLVTSTLTSLATEAIKKLYKERSKTYYANTIAGLSAFIISLLIGIEYTLITGTGFTSETIAYIVALIFMSWLCAMVGYDKVIQTITQFKTYRKDEDHE